MNQIDEKKGSKQELDLQSSPSILSDDKIRGLSLIFGSVEKGKSPSTYYFEKAWEVCQQKKWLIFEKNATLFSSLVNDLGQSLLTKASLIGDVDLVKKMIEFEQNIAYYVGIGNYRKAESLLNASLRILEKKFGKNHLETARTYNELAELYDSQGLYAKAEPLYIKALNRIRVLQKSHEYSREETGEKLIQNL